MKKTHHTKPTNVDLSYLAKSWPSAIVSREEVSKFSGGVISAKSLANLDAKGEGPSDALRIGRKVAYPVRSLIHWLEARSETRTPCAASPAEG